MKEQLQVSIDSDLCSGCGLCVEIAPHTFEHVEGLSHVKQDGIVLESMKPARILPALLPSVIEAANECPGEIIFVERASSLTDHNEG